MHAAICDSDGEIQIAHLTVNDLREAAKLVEFLAAAIAEILRIYEIEEED